MMKKFRKKIFSKTRKVTGFDAQWYLEEYADVKENGIDPLEHYILYGKNEGRSIKPVGKDVSNVKRNDLDYEFYIYYYKDLATLEKEEAKKHWLLFGKNEGRFPNLTALCQSINFPLKDLHSLNLKKLLELNPSLNNVNQNVILLKLLQLDELHLIKISEDVKQDAKFYLNIAKYYLIDSSHEKHKIVNLLLYSNFLFPLSEALELLGNYYIETNPQRAMSYYKNAININQGTASIYCFRNLNKLLMNNKYYEEGIKYLTIGLKTFPNNQTSLMKNIDDIVLNKWDFKQDFFHEMSAYKNRTEYINYADKTMGIISSTYKNIFQDTKNDNNKTNRLNSKNVLIIGDKHVPQCIRYRIDQKVEQLEYAEYKVKVVDWTKLNEYYEEIFFHDIIIYYRTPSVPIIIKSIEHAKSLGKITFYEIDDLLFDELYPPEYESYGGNITIEEYNGLAYGMPLFRNTAKLCEFAITSTKPLLNHLQPLVQSKKGYLHRNGLDSKNSFSNKKNDKFIDIFYGSGTLAHNSDFIDLVLDAISDIMDKNSNVRLIIMGHLTLPSSFLLKHKERVKLVDKTTSVEYYYSILRSIDINLAVLHNDTINNAKSELKWFEAACFKIPSIVSATQNYIDVIEDGKDALIATSKDDWFKALNTLISNKELRDSIGNTAYNRIISEYSIEALSKNIDNIIKDTIKLKENHE